MTNTSSINLIRSLTDRYFNSADLSAAEHEVLIAQLRACFDSLPDSLQADARLILSIEGLALRPSSVSEPTSLCTPIQTIIDLEEKRRRRRRLFRLTGIVSGAAAASVAVLMVFSGRHASSPDSDLSSHNTHNFLAAENTGSETEICNPEMATAVAAEFSKSVTNNYSGEITDPETAMRIANDAINVIKTNIAVAGSAIASSKNELSSLQKNSQK